MIASRVIDPLVKVRDPSQLLVMPRVLRVTSIDEEAVRLVSKEVSAAHQTGQPILPIVIDSYGGDPYAMWSMVDILAQSSIPIATVIEGKAMSCGAVLFCCGAQGHRYIAPNATLMIHDVSTDDVGGKKAEEAKVDAKETDRLNRKMYAFMEDRIGKPRGYLWKLSQERSRADWYITPREAVKYGVANKVGVPNFKTSVKVDITLE